MSSIRSRYIWILIALVTAIISPVRGHTSVNGNETRYLYSATGQKLRVVYYTAMPYITRNFGVQPAELTQGQILYKDSIDYLLGGSLVMKNGRIGKLYFDGGYARAIETGPTTDRFVFYYYNKDHLGNNREVVDAKARFYQVTSYYPFGAPYADPAAVSGADHQPYKYNGKELDLMHGLNTYDYGARQYDPILCRWDRVDPLCEKYYSISPYAYCANNPILLIDPNGLEPDTLEAALMAAYSYRDKNYSIYADQLKKRGWNIVDNISSQTGFKATIFSKTTEIDGNKQLEYAFAFAGTDTEIKGLSDIVETAKDIFADIQNYLGVGLSVQQFQAVNTAMILSSVKNEITYVGHSLGGGLAALASMLTGKTAITFNPASVNGAAKWLGNLMYGEKNITQYRTVGKNFMGGRIGGDFVNNFQQNTNHPSQGRIHPVYTNSYMPNHGIKTFVKAFGGYVMYK